MGNPYVTGWVATLIAIVACFAVHHQIDGVILGAAMAALGGIAGVSLDRFLGIRATKARTTKGAQDGK